VDFEIVGARTDPIDLFLTEEQVALAIADDQAAEAGSEACHRGRKSSHPRHETSHPRRVDLEGLERA